MTNEKEIQEQVQGELALVSKMKIITREDYETAGEALRKVKGLMKSIADFFAPMVKSAHEAHKQVKARENEATAPLEKAESELKMRMGDWFTAQEKIRIEAERKAAEEQRKIEAEAEKAQKEAAALEAETGFTPAPAILPSPVLTVVVPEKVVTAGVSMVDTWLFDITDPAALPREFLIVDEAKIRKVVQAMKGDTNIPGVTVRKVSQARVRA